MQRLSNDEDQKFSDTFLSENVFPSRHSPVVNDEWVSQHSVWIHLDASVMAKPAKWMLNHTLTDARLPPGSSPFSTGKPYMAMSVALQRRSPLPHLQFLTSWSWIASAKLIQSVFPSSCQTIRFLTPIRTSKEKRILLHEYSLRFFYLYFVLFMCRLFTSLSFKIKFGADGLPHSQFC